MKRNTSQGSADSNGVFFVFGRKSAGNQQEISRKSAGSWQEGIPACLCEITNLGINQMGKYKIFLFFGKEIDTC